MVVTRIHADATGESHFDEVVFALASQGPIGMLSDAVDVRTLWLRENDASYDYDWHTAPRRQFIVLLDGEIEVEVSDGETRRFSGGDILLVEDTHGKGHRTRTTNAKPRRSIFVELAEQD